MATLIPVSRARVYAGVMACIPVVFFVALEGGLRLAGYGDSYPIFVPVEEVPDYRTMNPAMARRYFAREPRVPTGLNDAFLAEKDSHVVRIFVQGGSSAAGYPYYYGGSFSRMLEQRLQQTWPDRHIEVVNTAVAAVNSYTLLDQSRAIIAEDPDVVLIYAGHNEFYGALGVGSTESLGRTRALVNLYLRIQALRTVQALRTLIVSLARVSAAQEAGTSTLMQRMVQRQEIALGSPTYAAGVRQFRGNLRSLLERYAHHGIPVFIGTLASNERTHPPFVSRLAPTTDATAWQGTFAAAVEARDARAWSEVIAMDSLAAAAWFALGESLDASGKYPEARAAYLAAKDRDQLRFRATEEFNVIVREEAAHASATVVDIQSALAAEARNGIIGSDLMLEHLHPNVEGYFIMANAFYEALYDAQIGGAQRNFVPRSLARKEVLFTEVDSLFGAYRIMQLLGSWPFQSAGQSYNPVDTVQSKGLIDSLALSLHRGERSWYEATDRLRSHYLEQGALHQALKSSLAMVQQFPFIPVPYVHSGEVLALQGRLDEAVTYFLAANDLVESAAVHHALGLTMIRLGRTDEAGGHLMRATAMDTTSTRFLATLAQFHIARREWASARAVTDRILVLDSDHAGARYFRERLANMNP